MQGQGKRTRRKEPLWTDLNLLYCSGWRMSGKGFRNEGVFSLEKGVEVGGNCFSYCFCFSLCKSIFLDDKLSSFPPSQVCFVSEGSS